MELILEEPGNEILKRCLDLYGYDKNLPVEVRLNTFDFNKAASCMVGTKVHRLYIPEREATREFLKENPHYRYPGGGLPNGVVGQLSPCWGKTRQYHKEGGC